MREYKFRGNSKDNNEFVYGDLIQLHDGRRFIVDNKFGACIDEKGSFINTGYPFVIEVIPESVGQYTEVYDEFGKEVYEGDEVKFAEDIYELIRAKVKYDKGSYVTYVKEGLSPVITKVKGLFG